MRDQTDELQAISNDGQTISLYTQHMQAQEEQAAKSSGLFGSILGFIGDLVTLNPLVIEQGFNNLTGAAVQVGMSMSDDQLAYQSSEAQTDETFQIALGQNIVRDDTLMQMIFDANSDAQTAAHEFNRQVILFTGAAERCKGFYDEVAQAQATWAAKTADLGRHLDPTFRLYRDQTGMQWDAAMQLLRKWTFLATRAFEYSANASYASGATVFAAANARELQGYLSGLQDAYQTDRLQNGWGQVRVDVLSVRRDLLGIQGSVTDPVTGRELTPAAQFHQLLTLPQNRDGAGNVSIKFRTSLGAANGVFGSDVCEDRIQGVKMNLVSSTLQGDTAYVSLRQVGQAELGACSGAGPVDYQLGGKTAQVPAGLNLSRSALGDPGLPASTDLFERPASADTWILTLDTHGEPQNRWIIPEQLDDIEIWLSHTARTLQPGG